MRNAVVSGILLFCFTVMFFLPSTAGASDITIHVSTPADFRYDDGKWRCYYNITIQNTSEGNITISWLGIRLINITYMDDTSEDLSDLSGYNFSITNGILKPQDTFSMGEISSTAYGFVKEPRIMWILLKTKFLEATSPLVATLPLVPEFPSVLILPLFMIATLLIVLFQKKEG